MWAFVLEKIGNCLEKIGNYLEGIDRLQLRKLAIVLISDNIHSATSCKDPQGGVQLVSSKKRWLGDPAGCQAGPGWSQKTCKKIEIAGWQIWQRQKKMGKG